jgi:hypothetical protein
MEAGVCFVNIVMKKLSYTEQLSHPNWQKKRLGILNRDGFQCKSCESKDKTLHVHHKMYLKGRMAWEYEDDNFETLCKDCHTETEQHREYLKLITKDFSDFDIAELIGFAKAMEYDGDYEDNTPVKISSVMEAQGWVKYWRGNTSHAKIIASAGVAGGKDFNPSIYCNE